ncbi:MAG: VOC family protein [Alphaproteobacteria bacterium]|nr:VOC family protein [Alphaproteobacteria bacterium]
MANPIPDGMKGALPYIFVNDGPAAMAWYCENLGGSEMFRMPGPGGEGLMHGEINIAGQSLMLSQANTEWGTRAPNPDEPYSVKLMVYVKDVDSVIKKCRANGAAVVKQPDDMFWGDRMGEIRDPFGHAWMIATHKEDVAEDEMQRRAKQMFGA